MKLFFSSKYVHLIAAMILASITSCTNADMDSIDNSNGDFYDEVSIILGGEYDNSSENQTRLEERGKYLGIKVYSKKVDEDESSYLPYAYGLFSDAEAIAVKLSKNLDYRFECMIIKDRGDKMFVTDDGYGLRKTGRYPFDGCIVYDKFVYSKQPGFIFSQPYISVIREDKSQAHSEELLVENADVEMFYGALDNYERKDGHSIEIPVYRIGYGLKVKVEGIADGSVDVNLTSAGFVCHKDNAEGNASVSESFVTLINDETFFRIFAGGLYTIGEYSDWKERILEYEKESDLSFTLKLGDGKVEKFDKTVHFKRNKTAILSLNPAKEAEIIFKLEDSELEDDIDTLLLKTKEWYDEQINVEL